MKANEGASALPTSIPEALETGNKWRKKRERWLYLEKLMFLSTHQDAEHTLESLYHWP